MFEHIYQFCCHDRNYAWRKSCSSFSQAEYGPFFFLSYAAGNILTAELKVFEQNQLAKLGN